MHFRKAVSAMTWWVETWTPTSPEVGGSSNRSCHRNCCRAAASRAQDQRRAALGRRALCPGKSLCCFQVWDQDSPWNSFSSPERSFTILASTWVGRQGVCYSQWWSCWEEWSFPHLKMMLAYLYPPGLLGFFYGHGDEFPWATHTLTWLVCCLHTGIMKTAGWSGRWGEDASMAQGYDLLGLSSIPTLGLVSMALVYTWQRRLPRLAWGHLFSIPTWFSQGTNVNKTGAPRVNTAPRRWKLRFPWDLISLEASWSTWMPKHGLVISRTRVSW